jgi:predicted metalloprotease
MKLRALATGLVACLALVAAGCGDDDKSDSGTTASAAPLTDVAPRTSKANLVGGNAAIEEFVAKASSDAIAYWGEVFTKSGLQYVTPTATVLAQAADNGCGAQFDPAKQAFFFCASDGAAAKLSFGAPNLDAIRTSNGDGGVAFLVGWAVALDVTDQVSGNPVAKTGEAPPGFLETSACFTGSWIRNLADRNILEAGDDQEILTIAGQALGGDATVSADLVKKGFNEGVGACQSGSGGGTPTESTPQPAPSPSG